MSLIEEALRRAQQGPVVPPAEPPPPPRATTPPATPPIRSAQPTAPSAVRRSSPVGVSVAFLCLLAAVGWWAFSRFVPPIPSRAAAYAVSAPSASPTVEPSATSPAPLPAPQSPSGPAEPGSHRFLVSGIVEGSGTPYAVIDGQVVSVGDTVGMATVLAIGQGVVRIRLGDGTEHTLAVTP